MNKKNTAVAIDETEEVAEEATLIPAKEIAAELGIDAKTFRRWLRKQTSNRAGKGGRWKFTRDEADALVALYAKADEPETDEDDEDPVDED